jgi:hypothetical protein
MLVDNMLIRYDGFRPSALTQSDVELVVKEILTEAPVGSSAEATFTQKNDIVKGFVHVHSSAGPFFAIATASEVRDVCSKLLGGMRRRLNKWKTKRYSHQTIHDIDPVFQRSLA